MERHWTALAIIPYTFGKYQVPLERGTMWPRGVMVTIKGGGELLLIITDHETGRQRGFGFVEMPDRTAARAAIAGLQGTELAGRVLNVDEAKPRPPSRERHQSR